MICQEPPNQHPARLLDDYLAVMRRRAQGSLPATALRTRSLAARPLLARAAAGSSASLHQLVTSARDSRSGSLDSRPLAPRELCDLARVVVLQEILPDDKSDGLALYELALAIFGPEAIPSEHQGFHSQLAYHLGERSRATTLITTYGNIPRQVLSYLKLDLANPFSNGPYRKDTDWLNSFQRLLPPPYPTFDTRSTIAPFDRLTTETSHEVEADEMISVIVTSFKPDTGLVTAVRSLIEQPWRNIEIIIVDDASPPEFDAIIKQCLDLDRRIRLIKLNTNAGTYVARNVALEAANGYLITIQDSDDWSHPMRLPDQAKVLLDEPSIVATVSDGLKVAGDLTVTQPGRNPRLVCTSSLMFRKDVIIPKVGYFDNVRKAADTEYFRRIEAAFGSDSVRRISGNIYNLIRQTPASLSRADFRAGWTHPARTAYSSAYGLWHKKIIAGDVDPYLPKSPTGRPFPAPTYIKSAPNENLTVDCYDVIFASEWRPYGGPQKSMLEEILALTSRGMRVGVLHMEAYRFMTMHRKPLCQPIQELINDGTVGHITTLDEVDVSLVVIRYPLVLQFAASRPSRIRAKNIAILANQAPRELDGTDYRYDPKACTEIARRIFGSEPIWYPQGPSVRDLLEHDLSDSELAQFDMPGIIDVSQWRSSRNRFRSDRPVIGRHARDNWTKWPGDRETLLNVYPDSDEVDVRIMGGASSAQSVLDTSALPPNWVIYDYDEVSVRSFLHQIDFYVYFPHINMVEAFGRSVLEALASGCVAILPHHFSRTFGDAAIYCEAEEVRSVVHRYYSTSELFLQQSRRAVKRVGKAYSHDSYFELVANLIASSGM